MVIDTALILAGGLGTRLRPLTKETPKPLLPMKGKPIVAHSIEQLKRHGVRNIILSIGFEAQKIQKYFADGCDFGVNISYSIEDEPLGTGGAIKKALSKISTPVFVVWGDNLMDIDYTALSLKYQEHKTPVTMTLTSREDVEHFGVAKLEEDKIVAFVEKPKREVAPSNLINAGAIVLDPQSLSMLPEGKSSIERDFYEKLAPGEIIAYVHEGQWFPTDTKEKYKKACLEFEPHINFKEKNVLIADVDETICESCQVISDQMANRIRELIKQGFEFAFISGTHSTELQRMISQKLAIHHHILGAMATNYDYISDDSTITTKYRLTLSQEEKDEIFHAFEKLIENYNIIPLTSKEDQLQDRESQITLSALGRHAPSEAKRKFDPEGNIRQEWITYLQQFLSDDKYDLKIGGTTSIDVTQKGKDKEQGIREFAKHNNIELNRILFIGDKIYPGGNDYPASKIVDCIAVRNPNDTLQELAKLVKNT